MSSILPNFSHIYIEEQVKDLPLTKRVLQRLPRATVVPIQHYKEIFNRPYQSWHHQRQSRKLILARKANGYLYPATQVMPRFGQQHVFYNTLMMNCIYDCTYCYLPGLYPSGHVVMFMNEQDYFDATRATIQQLGAISLCISYDTDLLAFERFTGFARSWAEFAVATEGLSIEIRTKSANIAALETLEPSERVVLAWTLSPQHIAEQQERGTASLAARIHAIVRATELGWPVRICLDPILAAEGWEHGYEDLVKQLFSAVNAEKIRDISIGVFRMSAPHLKSIQSWRFDAPTLYYPFEQHDGIVTYPEPIRTRMVGHVASLVGQHVERDRICVN